MESSKWKHKFLYPLSIKNSLLSLIDAFQKWKQDIKTVSVCRSAYGWASFLNYWILSITLPHPYWCLTPIDWCQNGYILWGRGSPGGLFWAREQLFLYSGVSLCSTGLWCLFGHVLIGTDPHEIWSSCAAFLLTSNLPLLGLIFLQVQNLLSLKTREKVFIFSLQVCWNCISRLTKAHMSCPVLHHQLATLKPLETSLWVIPKNISTHTPLPSYSY